MRKSAVIVGFGAFFLTMALLLKFYAYDHLAVVPIDQNTQQTLNDPNATYFDARTVGFKTGELITRVTAVADKKASEDYGKNTVVLDKWQITNDPEGWRGNNQGKWQPQAASQERVAINRHTGLPVHCCDESIDGNPVSHEGYQIKLPFNVDKNTTYNYWDGNQRKAFPLKFQGEEKVNGLTTYKYLWQTPEGVYEKQDVPGSLFGGSKDSAGVNADRSIQTTSTIWVEPQTGVFIKVIQHQQEWVVAPGKSKVQVLNTTQQMDSATVKKNVDDYKTKSMLLKQLRTTLPLVLGLLGIALLIIGILTAIFSGRRRGGAAHARRDDDAPRNVDERDIEDRRSDDRGDAPTESLSIFDERRD